jgi:predicted ATPase with chaperone activity
MLFSARIIMMTEMLSSSEIGFLRDFIKEQKSRRRQAFLREEEVEALKAFIRRHEDSCEPRLTHEFIQRLSDLVDMMPVLESNLTDVLIYFRAFQEVMREKNLLSDKELKDKVQELTSEMALPLRSSEVKELLEEAAKAYR